MPGMRRTSLTYWKNFRICQEHNLYLFAHKCHLFTKEVTWCGRKVSGNGYEMDASRIDWLKYLTMFETAGEPCKYVHCCRWMATAIPAFNVRIAPLLDILEQAYQMSGKRTKNFILSMPLGNLSWGDAHEDAFRSMQTSIPNSIKFSYPKREKVLCLFTHASDRFWSSVVSQTDEVQLSLELGEKKHEPLAFVVKMFKAAEQRWTTYEQQGFATFKSFEKLDYVMGDHKFHDFKDHINLLFLYSPSV